MKKRVPDLEGMIVQVQQQLTFLDKKIDALMGQAASRPAEPRPASNYQPREREMQRTLHKAICADCRKECEVPFKPSQDRPVYCKDCFSKRKGPSLFGERPDNKFRREAGRSHASHFDKPHDGGEKKKFFSGKKRPAVKRRKARG